MEKFLYHISSPKNIKSILNEGLKANCDGDIFVFENKTICFPIGYGKKKIIPIADNIALNQVFLKRFAMFEIDTNGINVDLINDDVAEWGHDFQWIVKQPIILPEFIKPFGLFYTRKGRTIKE